MSFVCAISGEIPQQPVVNGKNGIVYERRLVEAHIDQHHACPVSGDPLAVEDLIPLSAQSIVKPRPPDATSVPSLLSLFQSEWDSMAMDLFTVKKQYNQVRQELSHALYQHDAACRVIARLIRERDQARDALTQLKASGAVAMMDIDQHNTANAENGGEEQQSELQLAWQELTLKSAELSRGRKKRKMPEGLATNDQLGGLECSARLKSIHATTSPAIHAVAASPDGKLLATAGADKSILIHSVNNDEDNSEAPTTVATLKGHTKRVNSILFRPLNGDDSGEPMMLISASSDKTIRVWQQQPAEASRGGEWTCLHTVKVHKAEVNALAFLPVDWLFLSADSSGVWSLNSLRTGESLLTHSDPDGGESLTRLAAHPDGLIFATGSVGGQVKLWDLQSQTVAFEPADRLGGGVGGLAFSENGYFMATAGVQDGGRVAVWDLRKQSIVHTIDLEDESFVVNRLHFDYSGSYLAVGGTDLRVFANKTWEQLVHLAGVHKGELNDFIFVNQQASRLASVSSDRTLAIYSLPSTN